MWRKARIINTKTIVLSNGMHCNPINDNLGKTLNVRSVPVDNWASRPIKEGELFKAEGGTYLAREHLHFINEELEGEEL